MDYTKAARLCADHLTRQGHRNIGLIIGTNTFTGLDFRDAFFAACEAKGIAKTELPWRGVSEWDEQEGYEAARKLMSRHPGLTAIMAGNDRMAIGAIRYLLSKGLHVPRDVSVMGMDDIPSARYTTPGLTTLRMDLFELGRLSCQRLLAMLDGDMTSCHETREPHLVLRESTASARAFSEGPTHT
jgi:DNA-binding LacI/PurR family transcriptional regulator